MLWLISGILFALWLVGILTPNNLGGFVHVLLGGAILVLVMRLVRGKQLP